MCAMPTPGGTKKGDDQFVISIQQGREAVTFLCPQAELEVRVSRADVALLEYFEDPALLMGGNMKVTTLSGSTVTLHCSLENAQDWSIALLPEERDHEFMLQTKAGERRCAWGDDF